MASETKSYVQLGPRRWELGGDYLKPLDSCNHCLDADDIGSALRNQLNEKGYIYLKKVLPEKDVLNAKYAVLEYLQNLNDQGIITKQMFSSSFPDGILSNGCDVGCIPCMEGSNPITNHPAVSHIIESPHLFHIFTRIFYDTAPITFDYKWLRGMHQGGNTGCHMDRVYMNRGSNELLTCWIPFDNLTLDMSVLAVLEGSHKIDRAKNDPYTLLQHTYGDMDVDRDQLQGTGWFTEDPMEFYSFNELYQSDSARPVWKTTAFSAGDILIFTMRTIHMSSINLTNKLRLSCDTRWQPSNHSADPRFVKIETSSLVGHADNKFGIHGKDLKQIDHSKTTMDQWKKKWGFRTTDEILYDTN